MILTNFNQVTRIGFLLTMISCAAAPIPVTSDTKAKLQHAYQLMSDGKSLDAQKLIGEVLKVSEKAGDVMMVAQTYAVYGDLYKLGKTQDPLTLPDFKQAAISYQKAAENYQIMRHYLTESILLWTTGIMHSSAGDKDLACDCFDEAIKAFRLDSIDKNNIKAPEALPERIRSEQIKVGCI